MISVQQVPAVVRYGSACTYQQPRGLLWDAASQFESRRYCHNLVHCEQRFQAVFLHDVACFFSFLLPTTVLDTSFDSFRTAARQKYIRRNTARGRFSKRLCQWMGHLQPAMLKFIHYIFKTWSMFQELSLIKYSYGWSSFSSIPLICFLNFYIRSNYRYRTRHHLNTVT
jgi:hypothetical protein